MPYKLRKAPNRELYWVVTIETGKKHSKQPIPLANAKAQIRILTKALHGGNWHSVLSEIAQQGYEAFRDFLIARPELVVAALGIATATIQQIRELYNSFKVKGDGRHGGMMKVGNPLAAATPEQDAKKVIQRILDSANSARGMSITMKEGHKSMEAIMNESALELFKAGKAGAVQYLNKLREPYEARPEYKAEDSVARNKIAREMSLEIKGMGRHGGASGCRPPYHDYSKGKASAFVLTCIDPRYTFDVAYYLQHKKELHQDYDLFTLAGASVGAAKKEWTKSFFDNLELGLKLHGVKEVWCFDHLDCGMYKATFGLKKDLNPKIHKTCMDKLKKMVKKKYPQLKFREFLVDAHGHIKSMDKVGGNLTESIKTGLRRAIRYIYNHGNNLAYYSAIFAGAIATEQLTTGSLIEHLFSTIFPVWFSRLLLVLGHAGNMKTILDLLLEPLNIDDANPEDADPAAIEQPPEPSWFQRLLARREDNPGHLHQD